MSEKFPLVYRVSQRLARIFLAAITKPQWSGAENLPRQGGFIAVSNHVTTLDSVTFMHFLVANGFPVRVLAKDSLFRVPVVGWIAKKSGMVPVYRSSDKASDALKDAKEALRKGACVGIFPEGTLTRDPDLWPMKGHTGVARMALATGVPVIPVANWGAHLIKPPYSGKWNIFPRKTVQVSAGHPVDLADLYGKEDDHGAVNEATGRIMKALTQQLQTLREGTPPAVPWDMKRDGDRYAALRASKKQREK